MAAADSRAWRVSEGHVLPHFYGKEKRKPLARPGKRCSLTGQRKQRLGSLLVYSATTRVRGHAEAGGGVDRATAMTSAEEAIHSEAGCAQVLTHRGICHEPQRAEPGWESSCSAMRMQLLAVSWKEPCLQGKAAGAKEAAVVAQPESRGATQATAGSTACSASAEPLMRLRCKPRLGRAGYQEPPDWQSHGGHGKLELVSKVVARIAASLAAFNMNAMEVRRLACSVCCAMELGSAEATQLLRRIADITLLFRRTQSTTPGTDTAGARGVQRAPLTDLLEDGGFRLQWYPVHVYVSNARAVEVCSRHIVRYKLR
eukprot:2869805-Amphidinium_carterae.2